MGNYTRMPTEAEANEIMQSSFIDVFESTKYDPKDFKCIIVLGGETLDGIIDGFSREGQCLFIPYLSEEKTNVNSRSVSHIGYLYYGLKKYRFGSGKNTLTNILNSDVAGFTVSDEIVVPLLTLGHAMFYDVRYDELFPSSIFARPQSITSRQKRPLIDISTTLNRNNYRFGIEHLNDGILVKYGEELELDDFLSIAQTDHISVEKPSVLT